MKSYLPGVVPLIKEMQQRGALLRSMSIQTHWISPWASTNTVFHFLGDRLLSCEEYCMLWELRGDLIQFGEGAGRSGVAVITDRGRRIVMDDSGLVKFLLPSGPD